MSPVALNLLNDAYDQYQKTGSAFIEYECNPLNLVDFVNGVQELFEKRYIDDIPDYILDSCPTFTIGTSIYFTITHLGIEYMGSMRKL